jgi:integrase
MVFPRTWFWWIHQGEIIKYISRHVAHANIQMTLDTYGHLLNENSQVAMNRLDQRLRLGAIEERQCGVLIVPWFHFLIPPE